MADFGEEVAWVIEIVWPLRGQILKDGRIASMTHDTIHWQEDLDFSTVDLHSKHKGYKGFLTCHRGPDSMSKSA